MEKKNKTILKVGAGVLALALVGTIVGVALSSNKEQVKDPNNQVVTPINPVTPNEPSTPEPEPEPTPEQVGS